MGADPVFFDTSLLVAASVIEHPGHAAARAYIAGEKASGAPFMITPQVCREFLAVLTRGPIAGRIFSPREAIELLEEWRLACNLLGEDAATVDACVNLVDRHQVKGRQVHDCNIVAVMNTHGVLRVATRNPNDFRRYGIQVDAVAP